MFAKFQLIMIGMLCLVFSACQPSFFNSSASDSSSSTPESSTNVILTDTVGSSAQVSQATHVIFQPLLDTLREKTLLPVRLPTYVPETGGNVSLYALLENVSSSNYQILLAFTEDCTGGNACRLGSVSGENLSQQPSLLGDIIPLTKGLTGSFKPSICGANCSDATLTWEQKGSRYTVALKAGKVEQLVKMANSAILADPLLTSNKK